MHNHGWDTFPASIYSKAEGKIFTQVNLSKFKHKKGPNFHRPQNIVYAYYKAFFVNFAYGVLQQNNCLLCLLSQYVFMAGAETMSLESEIVEFALL